MRATSISCPVINPLFFTAQTPRNLTIISRINTVKNAPIGSIKANTPLIMPIELPIRKDENKTIRSKNKLGSFTKSMYV